MPVKCVQHTKERLPRGVSVERPRWPTSWISHLSPTSTGTSTRPSFIHHVLPLLHGLFRPLFPGGRGTWKLATGIWKMTEKTWIKILASRIGNRMTSKLRFLLWTALCIARDVKQGSSIPSLSTYILYNTSLCSHGNRYRQYNGAISSAAKNQIPPVVL
jgi:hypothetical protein